MCDTGGIALGKRYFWEEMAKEKEGQTAKELLNQISSEKKADVCVVGYHGRKGPKNDPSIMGTAC
jgi:hypothetical protein